MTANVEAIEAANAQLLQDLADLTGDKDHATDIVELLEIVSQMTPEQLDRFMPVARQIIQQDGRKNAV